MIYLRTPARRLFILPTTNLPSSITIAMNFGCHAAIISVLLILPSISVGAARFPNVTTTAAENGNSVVECWQFEDPFTTSTQPGVQGTSSTRLGNLLSGTYSIVPAGTNGGPHNAPAPQ